MDINPWPKLWYTLTHSVKGIYDEPKFSGRVFDADTWVAYCRELRATNALNWVKLVVIHHSATAESLYAKITLAQLLRNWWSYYRLSKDIDRSIEEEARGWAGAPQGVVMNRQPGIGELNRLNMPGVHAAGHNDKSVGTEIVGNYTSSLPANHSLTNAVAWAAGALYAARLDTTALRMHRSLPGNSTACPGNKLAANWSWFVGLVAKKLSEIADVPPEEPIAKRLLMAERALQSLQDDAALRDRDYKALAAEIAEIRKLLPK